VLLPARTLTKVRHTVPRRLQTCDYTLRRFGLNTRCEKSTISSCPSCGYLVHTQARPEAIQWERDCRCRNLFLNSNLRIRDLLMIHVVNRSLCLATSVGRRDKERYHISPRVNTKINQIILMLISEWRNSSPRNMTCSVNLLNSVTCLMSWFDTSNS
jgi:hypothetical protein